jgi:hypothetical protein
MTGYGKAALGLVIALVLAGPARAMEPLVGQWEKKIGKTRTVTLTFDNGRMHLSVAGAESFKIHSDCQATRDGVVYGVITSAEVDATDNSMEEDKETVELVDQPFSFRYRVDEGRLFIWGVKSSSKVLEEGNLVLGGFKSVQPTPTRTPACCYPPAAPVVPAVTSYKTKARR